MLKVDQECDVEVVRGRMVGSYSMLTEKVILQIHVTLW